MAAWALPLALAVTFKDFNNFPASDVCPPGTADPQWSSASECCCHGGSCLDDCCQPCQLGEFCPGDCRRYPCPAGTYQDQIGERECKMCPVMREMRDFERVEASAFGQADARASSTALRLIFYEQSMVGATSLAECEAAECWAVNDAGFRSNRNCSRDTGVTTVEPPVCTAAHGRPLCCCFRVWEHPETFDGPAPMEIAYETCGHMELDLRPDFAKLNAGKGGRRLGRRANASRAPWANVSRAPWSSALSVESWQRRLLGGSREHEVKPPTGPHRYEYVQDYRIATGDIGWDKGLPMWQDVGAGGYMEFTFYDRLTEARLALLPEGGADPTDCDERLLMREGTNPPTKLRFELNRPLPACVPYPVPPGGEGWSSTGKYFHIKECSYDTVYGDAYCDSSCEEMSCQFQGVAIFTSPDCQVKNVPHALDWSPP